ncbi:MAG: YHS domain-containing (seleno)protein [Parvibaculaceae bacterium]|jgi:YHS domain-containing protein
MIGARAFFTAAIAAFVLLGAQIARADGVAHSTVGVAGYDLVSYQTNQKPLRGNGHNVSVHDGVTYLFASKENKALFEADPEKYLPAFGGHCAFAAAVGKKFFGDPEVWRVVDGRLYLNLDTHVQDRWLEDVDGMIARGNANWEKIRDIPASEL